MRIAVLGGGNGSYAAAADLSAQGHDIRLWRRDGEALAALTEAGGLLLEDYRGERRVPIGTVTADIAAALTGAELVVVPTPAFAQQDIARAMAPYLVDDQVVFLPPGSFGCYLMSKALREAGADADVAFAETGTLPYLTRKHGPTAVTITTRATRLPTGVFPARSARHACAIVKRAYPAIELIEDGLSGALMNAGPIIHPPLILMNAGAIEHFQSRTAPAHGSGTHANIEHWDIHHEGTQPSIRRVTDRLDGERVAVREALGYGPPHFPLADHYDPGGDEWMYGNLAHEKLIDSGDWRERLELTRHRYMTEDIGCALAFLVSVADWAGVDCPVARGLLALGSAVTGIDYRRDGRTLENLGLADCTPEQMKALLHQGCQ